MLHKTVSALFAISLAMALVPAAWASEAKADGESDVNGTAASVLSLGDGGERVESGSQDRGYEPAAPSVSASTTVNWKRLWGQTEFDTMQRVVQEGWKSNAGGTVVVATAEDFPDALSAAGVAGLYGAPVLITKGTKLSDQTASELRRIKPKRVIIAGGPKALTESVERRIESITGVDAVRTYGRLATDTAATLNRKYFGKRTNVAILATVKGFQDALSAAPVAYAKHYPVFLVDDVNSISANTLAGMKACGIKQVIIVGGEKVVGPKVVTTLRSNGITVKTRLYGSSAYDTSNAIAGWAVRNGMKATNTGAATGVKFYDALCGAALCGKKDSALILVDKNETACISDFVRSNASAIKTGYIFGGASAVNSATANMLSRPDSAVNYLNVYKPILQQAQRGTGAFSSWPRNQVTRDYTPTYALYDINRDGVKELIVQNKSFVYMMAAEAIVYTVKSGKAVNAGTISLWREGTLGHLSNGTLFYITYFPPENEGAPRGVYTVSLSGTKVTSKHIWHGYVPITRTGSIDYTLQKAYGSAGSSYKMLSWTRANNYSALR